MRIRPRRCHSAGFTLVELLVVLLIVSVLSAIAVLLIPRVTKKADHSACEADRREIARALAAYEGTPNPPGSLGALANSDGISASDIVGNTLIRERYTLTYTPATGSVDDCTAALAAGGSGRAAAIGPSFGSASATPSTGASASASPGASASPSPPSAPTVSCTATDVRKNRTTTGVAIGGTGFGSAGATVTVSGTDVTAVVTAQTPSSLTLSVTVAPNAAQGLRGVQVTNSENGLSSASVSCLNVTPN